MDISSGLDLSWVNYLSRILLSDLQVFLGLTCHLTFSPLPPHPSFFLLLFCLFLLLLLDFMAKESLKVSWRGCWYLFILDLRTYSLILLWSSGLRGSMMIINMAIGDFVSLPFFFLNIRLKNSMCSIKGKTTNKTITLCKQKNGCC